MQQELIKLFDFQKFQNNKKMEGIISNVEKNTSLTHRWKRNYPMMSLTYMLREIFIPQGPIKMIINQNEIIEKLYEEYKDKVYHYAYSKLCNHSEAEDLVSEIFEKILKNIHTYDPSKASHSRWIYTIARNTVYNYLRSKGKAHMELDELIDLANSEPLPDAQLLTNESLEELAEVLVALPERERDIIILRFYYNHTPQQVADMIGVSYNNVKVIQVRALKRLQKMLSVYS
jgi:RNA polymerase sigma-70 factor (ECF subfamily)